MSYTKKGILSARLGLPEDESEIRSLLADIPMPGTMRISYRKDPSFFGALQIEGKHNDTVVVCDTQKGRIAGFGTRSIKKVFINGVEQSIGYFSNLRVHEDYRRGVWLYRGFKKLKQLHEDGRTSLYLTTILEKNSKAIELLTSRRSCLPAYHDIGQLYCAAIGMRQYSRFSDKSTPEIRRAESSDIPAIIEFTHREGRTKQFYPVYDRNDLEAPDGLLRGIDPENILLAMRDRIVCGCLAVWDQRPFRQTVVAGYAPALNAMRSPLNALARLSGYPLLPPAGQILNLRYLSLICIKDNDKQIFKSLISNVFKLFRGQFPFVMVGFHENDPLLDVVKKFRHIPYTSRIYVACWEDGENDYSRLDQRIPYLELGSL
jgi:hypothetical protein